MKTNKNEQLDWVNWHIHLTQSNGSSSRSNIETAQFYGANGSIWEWDRKGDASPLIKQLIDICKEMVLRLGSVEVAKVRLASWFSGQNGVALAYDFFVHKVGKWP